MRLALGTSDFKAARGIRDRVVVPLLARVSEVDLLVVLADMVARSSEEARREINKLLAARGVGFHAGERHRLTLRALGDAYLTTTMEKARFYF